MKLFDRLKLQRNRNDDRRLAWRERWNASIDDADGLLLDSLRAELQPFALSGEDVEVELEMLDAVERLASLRAEAARASLPVVETQHRVLKGELCHFTAPVSLPSDPTQTSGRVLFTPSRSLFVGGSKTSAMPWHAVQHIVRTDRDLLLARAGGAVGAQFRFNTYADSAIATFLARELKKRIKPPS